MYACRFVFFGASTKCHVGEVRDRRDALQRTSADSVCDACVLHCILNFPWTWVTSVRFRRTALLFTVWVDFCHCCMYTHQVTFYSSCFSTSHFSCSAFSSWFVVLVDSLQLVYYTRALECLYVRACIVRVSIAILWHAGIRRTICLKKGPFLKTLLKLIQKNNYKKLRVIRLFWLRLTFSHPVFSPQYTPCLLQLSLFSLCFALHCATCSLWLFANCIFIKQCDFAAALLHTSILDQLSPFLCVHKLGVFQRYSIVLWRSSKTAEDGQDMQFWFWFKYEIRYLSRREFCHLNVWEVHDSFMTFRFWSPAIVHVSWDVTEN